MWGMQTHVMRDQALATSELEQRARRRDEEGGGDVEGDGHPVEEATHGAGAGAVRGPRHRGRAEGDQAPGMPQRVGRWP